MCVFVIGMMEATQPRDDIWMRITPFPFALAKVMHKASASIILGICMVALAPNYRHNALLAAIAVPSALLALSAVAAFAVVAAAVAVTSASTASI